MYIHFFGYQRDVVSCKVEREVVIEVDIFHISNGKETYAGYTGNITVH